MRAFDIALASLALRTAPDRQRKLDRALVPHIDGADAATLDRGAVAQDRAALISSLWPPPTRQCVARPLYEEHAAPAVFGLVFRVKWRDAPDLDVRALQARLRGVFADRA